ncbi:hypothetical protein ACEWY4_024344 [Coilia grayii]|uniref:Schlafen AlbA-2 domain-containing protein n=1 Tax=Coilia grayii TaxID=363190 RepID=A0ABD1J1R9_9TELE
MERRRSKNRGLRGKKGPHEDITGGAEDCIQSPGGTVSESAPVAQPNVWSLEACSSSSKTSLPQSSIEGQQEEIEDLYPQAEAAGCSDSPDPKERLLDQHALHSLQPGSTATLYKASDSDVYPTAQPPPVDDRGPEGRKESPEEEDEEDVDDDDDDDDELVIRKGWVGAVGGGKEQRGALTAQRDQRVQECQQQLVPHYGQQQWHHHLLQQQQQQQDQHHQQQDQHHQQQDQHHQQQEQHHQQQEQHHQQQEQHHQQQDQHHQQQEQQRDLQLQQERHHLLQMRHQPQLQMHLQEQQQQLQYLLQTSHHPHHQQGQQQKQQQQHKQHRHQQQPPRVHPHPHQQHVWKQQPHQQYHQQLPHHQQQHHGQQQPTKTRPPRGKETRQNQQIQQAACEQAVFLPPPHGIMSVSGTQSDSAISGQEIVSEQRLFYGARVGSETRNVEFKRGGGEYLRSTFRSHLRRYACAFLNSGGGMLLVGVDDEGVVRGVHCDHRQEDRARLLVDSVLKFFQPPLLPQCYSLSFLPVVRPGPEGLDLKVLRLALQPPPVHTQLALYQTDQGEIFLRRDGSVEGPLSANAIQEWARQRWSGEVMRLQHCIQVLLAEQGFLLQEIRQQSLTIVALQQTQMLLNAPTPAPTPTPTSTPSPVPAPPAQTPPRLEGLRDRLLKVKLSRRVSPSRTPQSLSVCPSSSETPEPASTPPAAAGSHHHLAAVVKTASTTQLRGSCLPQGYERTWGAMEEGPGPPQSPQGAETEAWGTQTPVSAACNIM